MSSAKNPLFAEHCAAIHANGMSITPYRIGMQVGERGENLDCPYTNRKSIVNYLEGVKVGRRVRREKQAVDKATGHQGGAALEAAKQFGAGLPDLPTSTQEGV